ncbi:MAG: signal peptide peptidase SppA [Neisseriaceae bacterium]|nr:signal peptide peptidase SppA [Neisseriaceae bacterium]
MNQTPPPVPEYVQNQRPADTWERQLLEKLLMENYREHRKDRLHRWLRLGVWALLFLMLFFAMTGKSKGGSIAETQSHTAVIDLSGTIDGENQNADKLIKGLKNAYKNDHVKGIIIRADSPGGSPVIADVAFTELRRLKALHQKIPVYVVAGDVCASGCYYIASAADKIYANPSSLVGSIGVISSGFGATELMQKIGVERRLKTAGSNKGMGDPFSPETPEQMAIWQNMLDEIHAQFISAVKKGRGSALKWQNDPDVFSGRVYTGSEAQKVGLIDDFGNIYSVSRDVIGAEKLVDYTPQEDFATVMGRKLGVTAKQSLKTLSEPSW